MTKKRSDALDAIIKPMASGPSAEVVPLRAERPQPKPSSHNTPERTVVMLYLPRKVKRKIDEMAFKEDRKANDIYLRGVERVLREAGHSEIADMLSGY
jgi:hypothetical protein